MGMIATTLLSGGAFCKLDLLGAEGKAASAAIRDRLTTILLKGVADHTLYVDGEEVRSTADLAASFGADGRYERYDEVRTTLREWLDPDLEFGEELLELVDRHLGEVTGDEDERDAIGSALVDEAVLFALNLIERWGRDKAASTEADLILDGMRESYGVGSHL